MLPVQYLYTYLRWTDMDILLVRWRCRPFSNFFMKFCSCALVWKPTQTRSCLYWAVIISKRWCSMVRVIRNEIPPSWFLLLYRFILHTSVTNVKPDLSLFHNPIVAWHGPTISRQSCYTSCVIHKRAWKSNGIVNRSGSYIFFFLGDSRDEYYMCGIVVYGYG